MGTMKNAFPLPNGQKLGRATYLYLGSNLTKVEMMVKKDKNGKVKSVIFIGYQKFTGREKIIRSYWQWTGEELQYQRREEEIIDPTYKNEYAAKKVQYETRYTWNGKALVQVGKRKLLKTYIVQ